MLRQLLVICFYIVLVKGQSYIPNSNINVAQRNNVNKIDVIPQIGRYQTPIDLNNPIVPVVYRPLNWSCEYNHVPRISFVRNEEKLVTVGANYDNDARPFISGGPLASRYIFFNFHFHWGSNNDVGSEHTVFKKRFPMELHVIHVREDLNFTEALKVSNGLAVVGYFVQLCKDDNPIFNRILQPFRRLRDTRNVDIPIRRFALAEFFPQFSGDYFNYEGGLTGSPFQECVRWIVSNNVLKISQRQLDLFRALGLRNPGLKDNWRPTQSLAGRTLYYNQGDQFIY